jgi:cyclin H
MNAAVSISEILNAEMHLIEGVNFELLYFHPYNSIMAFTEDLRTFLKSEVGSTLVSFMKTEDDPDSHRILTGDDLRPMHDEARRIIDDAVVSDIPLLASPGQIGLCSLIVAGEALIQGTVMRQGDLDSEPQKQPQVPRINFHEYIKHRFSTDHKDQDIDKILVQIDQVCSMLCALKEGNFGCGNPPIEELKKIHKKLKACHAWGGGPSMEGRKKKKRKREDPRE